MNIKKEKYSNFKWSYSDDKTVPAVETTTTGMFLHYVRQLSSVVIDEIQ